MFSLSAEFLGSSDEHILFLGKLNFVIMFLVGFSIGCLCFLQNINATTGYAFSVHSVSNRE